MRRRALLQGGEIDYSQQYLTFKALEAGTFTLSIPSSVNTSYVTSVSYSLDNGSTWTTTNNSSSNVTITTPSVSAGGTVLWKGTAISFFYATTTYGKFTSTGSFDVCGNIMSLLYGDSFADQTTLPSTKKGNFYHLFYQNTNIISADNLVMPATTLTDSCYEYMFSGCTNLTKSPKILPATTLSPQCYRSMFSECTSLTTAPELPATTLANNCYRYMFSGCTSLTTAPELPATTLAEYCYENMFRNCSNLTTAPELPATTLATYCYSSMFYGCSSLSYIKCNAQEIPSTATLSNCFNNWVRGVSTDGRFYFNPKLYWITGNSGMPVSWDTYTIEDATQDYLTFIAKSSGTYTFTIPATVTTTQLTSISYSLDDGATWTTTNNSRASITVTTPTVSAYSRVLWKGSGSSLHKDANYYCTFSATMDFCVAGNIMSLLYDNFKTRKSLSTSDCFFRLFMNNTKLVNAAGLMLPATSLSTSCYYEMFKGCTNLTHSPVLPAITLSKYCYTGLFNGCTSLAYIKAMFTTTPSTSYTQNWVNSVASSGTFVKNSAATWTTTGANGVPSGWTVRTASS